MKIRPVGDELFHADGHTNIPKLTVDIRNFISAHNPAPVSCIAPTFMSQSKSNQLMHKIIG